MNFHWGSTKNRVKLCIYGETGMLDKDGQMEWTESGHSRPVRKLYGISFGPSIFIGIMLLDKGTSYRHSIANKE